MNKRWVILALIILFCLYLFLFGLGRMALIDPDEPFYAQTAKEMFKRGEWLTPRIFGEPQFEKPPLYYWLIIISYKLFGINEFTARLPSAIFGLLGIIGIYLLAELLFSQKTAIYSSLIMAASIEYAILARACVTDMVLCVFILYFFLFFFYGYLKENKKIPYLLASISVGFSVLTKGPVGVVLPALILTLYLLFRRDLKAVTKFPLLSSAIVFLVVAVPWYYLMYKTYGNEFMNHFFGFQNISRFLVPEHEIGDVFYYYIPIIIGGFFPWSIFLPYGIFIILKKDKERFGNHLFLLIWILVFFIFFSVSRTKLPTYIFPLFPALAIAIGRFWELIIDNKIFGKGVIISGVLYLASLPISLIIFYIFNITKYSAMCEGIIKSSLVLAPLFILSSNFLLKRKLSSFLGSIILTPAICLIPLVMFISPYISLYESSKDFSFFLKNASKPEEKIGAETGYRRGVTFYLDRDDIIDVHQHHIITKFLDSKQRVWVVIKDKNHQQLYTDAKLPFWLPTYVIYEFGKKVIVTNKIPEDGRYIKKRSIDEPL